MITVLKDQIFYLRSVYQTEREIDFLLQICLGSLLISHV